MPRMTKRNKATESKTVTKKSTPRNQELKETEEVQKDIDKPKNDISENIENSNQRGEFYFKASDEYDRMPSHLICQSNNGSDHPDKSLRNARSKKMKKPILVEIKSDYKFPNYSLSVDEAKELRDTLDRMIDYLEEV